MEHLLPHIDKSWTTLLAVEFEQPYFQKLNAFIANEKIKHKIFPPEDKIFNAFARLPFDQVKVVILGQDPYHGEGQAHGLSFSVPHETKIPPSLKNIYKEMSSDLNTPIPSHGNLEKWTDQGVFLLNASLTVRAHEAGAHQKKGWENFTDRIIHNLSEKRENLVFILWGNYAHKKEALINASKHCILKSAHPSPLSAHNGFWQSKPFSKTNTYLAQHNISPIDWML